MTQAPPDALPDLAALDPGVFEDLALDALRAHVAQDPSWLRMVAERLGCPVSDAWAVTAYRTPFGRRDGGYDGEIFGLGEGGSRIAVEAKRTKTASALRDEVKKYLDRPGRQDRPVLFLSPAELSKDDVESVEDLGRLVVVGRGDLNGWLRDHPYVARAHGLSRGSGVVTTLAGFAKRLLEAPSVAEWNRSRLQGAARQHSTMLPTEQAGIKRIIDQLPGPGEALLVSFSPKVIENRIRAALTWRLLGGQDVQGRETFVVPRRARELSRDRWETEIGRPPQGARLWIPAADRAFLANLLLVVPEPASLGWWVEVPKGQLDGARTVLEKSCLTVREVQIEPPPLPELRAWAHGHVAASGRRRTDPDLLTEQLRLRDLIEIWMDRPDYLPLYVADFVREVLPPGALNGLGWAALLQPLNKAKVKLLRKRLGVSVEGLKSAQKRGLVTNDSGGWRPATASLGSAFILASLHDEVITHDHLKTVHSKLSEEEADALVARVAKWRARMERPRVLGSFPDAVLESMDFDTPRKLRLLARAPVVFAGDERDLRWAWEHLSDLESPADAVAVARNLSGSIEAFPQTLDSALEALGAFAELSFDAAEVITESLRPKQSMAEWFVGALDVAHVWVNDPKRSVAMRAVIAALPGWLAMDVEYSEVNRRGALSMSVAWNAESMAVREAFRAAADLEIASLGSSVEAVRDLAWASLSSLGMPTSGLTDVDPPDPLVEQLERILDEAIELLPRFVDLVDRGMAERALSQVIGIYWGHGHAARVIEALRSDPLYRAFRWFSLREGFVPDPRAYLAAIEAAGSAEQVNHDGFTEGHRATVAVLDALAQELVTSGCGAVELSELLDAAGRLVDRTQKLDRYRNRPWGHSQVLTAWAEKDPSIFEPYVMSDRWRRLHPEVRWWLLSATSGIFADRWVSVLDEGSTPRQGVGAAVARLLRDPARVEATEAQRLLGIAYRAASPGSRMALLHRVADHPAPGMRRAVFGLLEHSLMSEVELDPRDVDAILRRLISPPSGLENLMRLDREPAESPLHVPPHSDWEVLCLDAFEEHLCRKEDGRSLFRGVVGVEVRPLVERWAERRPERVWKDAWVFQECFSVGFDGHEPLHELSGELRIRLLNHAPADLPPLSHAADLHDNLVRSLTPATFSDLLGPILEADPPRAALWVMARGLRHETLEPLITLLQLSKKQLSKKQLDTDQRRRLIENTPHELGACGTRTRGGPVGPDDDLFARCTIPDDVFESLEARASQLPVPVAKALRTMMERARPRR